VPGSDRWRWVGRALALGAAYDFAFAVAILGFTHPAAQILGLAVPRDPVYLGLNGLLLLLLAALYAAASLDPERYRAITPIAGLGRLAGFVFFLAVWSRGWPLAFAGLAAGDLVLGLGTLVAWRRAVVLSD